MTEYYACINYRVTILRVLYAWNKLNCTTCSRTTSKDEADHTFSEWLHHTAYLLSLQEAFVLWRSLWPQYGDNSGKHFTCCVKWAWLSVCLFRTFIRSHSGSGTVRWSDKLFSSKICTNWYLGHFPAHNILKLTGQTCEHLVDSDQH